jgi:chemotaxis protein methyltransferase CheR
MTAGVAGEREFAYTHEDFEFFRDLALKHTGIRLADAKREMVYSRLARACRRLGLPDLASYAALLRSGDAAELKAFVNAITTNLTAFFREAHHFAHLREEVLPALLAERGPQARIRIWSCAASTGEEPYSLAITAHEALAAHPEADLRILASDIDSDVLAVAERGVYEESRIASVPPASVRGAFLRGRGAHEGCVRVRPEVRARLAFRRINLLESWPMRGKFDIVFCRNVVIYFDKPTQRRLFDRIADLLQPPGLLYLGHAESLYQVSDRFESVGRTVYRKVR